MSIPRVRPLNQRLIDGYNRIITEWACRLTPPASAPTGASISRRARSGTTAISSSVDKELFWQYFLGMLNRGMIPGGQFYDEQWTISVVHTEADIDAHLAAFADVARSLTAADQKPRSLMSS